MPRREVEAGEESKTESAPTCEANPGLHAARCLHCRTRAARTGRNGSRGLCGTCHADLSIRNRYPTSRSRKRTYVAGQPCRHCAAPLKVGRRRGLCWKCRHDPAIRDQYTSEAPTANRAVDGGDGCALGRGRGKPTDALPGTEEKILVMRARASRGKELFHPQDATFADAPPPSVDIEAFVNPATCKRRPGVEVRRGKLNLDASRNETSDSSDRLE